jgi:hypothetical protein
MPSASARNNLKLPPTSPTDRTLPMDDATGPVSGPACHSMCPDFAALVAR